MRIARLSPATSRTLTHRVYQIKANQAPQIRAPNVHEVRQVDDSIDSASAGKNRPRTIQPAACKPPGSSVYDLQCTNAPGCKDTWHNGTWPIMRIPESKTLNVELVDLTKGTQGPKLPEDRTKRARSLGLKDGSFEREFSRAHCGSRSQESLSTVQLKWLGDNFATTRRHRIPVCRFPAMPEQ